MLRRVAAPLVLVLLLAGCGGSGDESTESSKATPSSAPEPKLIRRNPHVFAGVEAGSLAEIEANWERIKQAEKARTSVLDGIALSQPALSLAAKILDRAGRAGLTVPLPPPDAQPDPESRLGATLLATVAGARQAGLDPEAALRKTTLKLPLSPKPPSSG